MSERSVAVSSVREVIDLVANRRVPAGATVELSLAHPELRTLDEASRLCEGLKRYGIRLIRRRDAPTDQILIHPPGECPLPSGRTRRAS